MLYIIASGSGIANTDILPAAAYFSSSRQRYRGHVPGIKITPEIPLPQLRSFKAGAPGGGKVRIATVV